MSITTNLVGPCCVVCVEDDQASRYRPPGTCNHYCHVPLGPLPDEQPLCQREACPRCDAVRHVRVVGFGQPVLVECKTCSQRFSVTHASPLRIDLGLEEVHDAED